VQKPCRRGRKTDSNHGKRQYNKANSNHPFRGASVAGCILDRLCNRYSQMPCNSFSAGIRFCELRHSKQWIRLNRHDWQRSCTLVEQLKWRELVGRWQSLRPPPVPPVSDLPPPKAKPLPLGQRFFFCRDIVGRSAEAAQPKPRRPQKVTQSRLTSGVRPISSNAFYQANQAGFLAGQLVARLYSGVCGFEPLRNVVICHR
jgi:hypothetical protein